MEGQSVVSSHQREIVIDIEPLTEHIKPEPLEEDYEAEYDEYNEEYEEDATYRSGDDGERDDSFAIEQDDNDFSSHCVKEEPHYPEDMCDTTLDEETSDNSKPEINVSKSELTVHALPGTSTECDNMIYFEIPAMNNSCKCVVCGSLFVGSKKGSEYICNSCLKKEDFTKDMRTQKISKPITSSDHASESSESDNLLMKGELDGQYECDICLKKCISTSDLNKHRLVHSGERPFGCQVCRKRFNQLSNLIRHKLTHSQERPFQCEVCSKTFTQSSYLKKHNLIHSGEKPYGCVVCLKRFSDYSTLSKHKLIHSGEKPYCCGICSKTFNQVASLRRHEIIHRDQKPFQCTVCLKRFAQTHHLKRHLNVHRVKFVNMTRMKYRKPKPNQKQVQITRGVGHQMTEDAEVHHGEETFRIEDSIIGGIVDEINCVASNEVKSIVDETNNCVKPKENTLPAKGFEINHGVSPGKYSKSDCRVNRKISHKESHTSVEMIFKTS